jgi:hypothetical protein
MALTREVIHIPDDGCLCMNCGKISDTGDMALIAGSAFDGFRFFHWTCDECHHFTLLVVIDSDIPGFPSMTFMHSELTIRESKLSLFREPISSDDAIRVHEYLNSNPGFPQKLAILGW